MCVWVGGGGGAGSAGVSRYQNSPFRLAACFPSRTKVTYDRKQLVVLLIADLILIVVSEGFLCLIFHFNGVGRGVAKRFTCPYPLKVQTRPPRDQKPAV